MSRRETLTTGAAMRLHLTPAEIVDLLPDALHACAMGTYRPAEAHDTAAKNATHGPRVDESGELGQVWRVSYRSNRHLAVILAIDPEGTGTAWALADGADTLDTGTHEGRMSIGEALDIIDAHERGEV